MDINMEKIMKRTVLAALFFAVLCANVAVADPDPLTDPWLTIDRATGYFGSSGGGEFTIISAPLSNAGYSSSPQTKDVTTPAIPGAGSFQSFCLEKNEYVDIPQSYQYTVDTFAYKGGYAGGTPDPLGAATAWLYTQFATGVLSGYNYAAGRTGSADQLQNAIWYLENEIASVTSGSQAETWVNAAQAAAADSTIWGNKIGNVRVLNLYTASVITHKQSQLYMVPVPGAMLLGFLGLGYAGMRLRKVA